WSMAKDGSDVRQHTFGQFDDREPEYANGGSAIIFSSDRAGNYDLWRVDLASGALTQLTNDPADDYAPSVNRTSGDIAFVSTRAPAGGVYVLRADGSTVRWATSPAVPNAPSWSPDGTRLAWTALGTDTARLMMAKQDSAPRALSPAGGDAFPFRPIWLADDALVYTGDGVMHTISTEGAVRASIPFDARVTFTRTAYAKRARDFEGKKPAKVFGIVEPALSPDGRTIVFAALGDLFTWSAGKVTRLTNDPYVEYDPAWSPDGKRLAFVSDRSGAMELWLRDVTSGETRAITTHEGGAGLPAWSPDGSEIVYQVNRGLLTDLRAVNVANGAIRKVRGDLFLPSRVTFSPDGSMMAVAALRPYSARFREGRNDILFFDKNGKNVRWMIPPGGRGLTTRGADGPVWSPDGHRLAFIQDGQLMSIPITPMGEQDGPAVRHSLELANSPSFSADGRTLCYQATDGLRLVSLADGALTKIDVPLTWTQRHPTHRIVVHAGRFWDGTAKGERTNVDIVIQGHRIVKVAAHDAALHKDSVVDASDLTVIPGLVDGHTHEGFGVGEGLGRTWLSYGITTIRDPASDPFQMRERREAVESGRRVGPRALSTGRLIDGERIYYGFNNSVLASAQLQQELERANVMDFSLIKTYVRLDDRMQATIIAYGHAHGIPIASHELYPSVASGGDHVEHISGTSRRGYSPKMSRLERSYGDVIQLLTASGMSLTPTMALQGGWTVISRRDTTILDDPRLAIAYGPDYVTGLKAATRAPQSGPFAVTPNMVAALGKTVTRVLHGGGLVMAGTDSPIIPFGLGLHIELQSYVENGLTPREALMTATSGFARIVGLDKDLGTIAPGKLADLIAVEGDPLTTITDTKRVRVVVKDGDVYTEERLVAGAVVPPGR
ncbi:MAG TPA: amidohydrolase family protein, partial [Gemmatimonadaceae bacterium]|nr:amidohydrolase family protein [Gemmatimonadaceae bacterium]